MISAFIQYGLSRIHYRHFGNGAVRLVALHGYGESSSSFLFLEKYLDEKYQLIAIDMPFHGLTQWNESRPFTCADITSILSEIFKEMGFPDTDLILIGYSMGGRLALSITQQLPQKVSRVLLLAPDGLKVNFWYWLATQTLAGNRLFLFTMKNPRWFFRLIQTADRFSLINKSIYKFMLPYIGDETARLELYHRWTCMRTFKPNLEKIRTIIRERNIPVRMLYGKHDRIILSKRAGHFYRDLERYCHLHVIDAGHNILQKKYADIITGLLTT